MSGIEAMAIRTERLELVPVRVEDAEEMARVLGDPALHTYIGGAPESVEQLRSRYERWCAGSPDPMVTWLNWVIRLRSDGRLAGTVQATIGPDGDDVVAEVAWVVGTPWQGQGIATEAAGALVEWLAEQPVHEIVAHIHPDHAASAAVAAAAGLTPTDRWQDGERRWRRSIGR
ncbi:GNAT family N-acetyltransferase [Actinocatenispora sera]|uniref:GNAT family N-acetyltransferase n=1 Tax=Actinocatenispora sera TaxID=390989 RepID=UPI0033CD0A32